MNYKNIKNKLILYFIINFSLSYSMYIDNHLEANNLLHYNDGRIPIWDNTNITWKYEPNYQSSSKGFNTRIVLYYLEQAFNFWKEKIGNYLNIKAIWYLDPTIPDIKITFEDPHHHDGYNFSSGIMAHTYFPGPGLGGDIHFNSNVDWKLDNENNSEFYLIAVHEIGHALGLTHVDDPNSIMYPIYMNHSEPFISQENIDEFKFLYNIPHNLSEYDIIKIYKNHGINIINTETKNTDVRIIEKNIYKKIKQLINKILKKINNNLDSLYT